MRILMILLFMVVAPAWACLNAFNTDADGGHAGDENMDVAQYLTSYEGPSPEEQEKAARTRMKKASPAERFKDESDLAVALLKQWKTPEALKILERLADDHPLEYAIATNLGTAYELAGKNEKALTWINRGIDLNPESHGGTEWLHARILNAKIAHKEDPTWFERNTVLGLNFGKDSRPAEPEGFDKDSYVRLETALKYQLHERLFFVKPPDPYVADLLFDLSNVLALRYSLEAAKPVLQMALDYGLPREKLGKARMRRYERLISVNQNWVSMGMGLFVGTVFIIGWLGFLGVRAYLRRNR